MRITAARGEPEFTTLEVYSQEFEIQGETYMWEFFIFVLWEFDTIIGMDWLGYNPPFLDCERKSVLKGCCKCEMGLIFQGSLVGKSSFIVSYANAVKLIGQGCQAYIKQHLF